MRGIGFTESEEDAIAEAVGAYRTANRVILARSRERLQFEGETPDQILTRHGVGFRKCFTEDHWRYGRVVGEVIRRAGT